MSKGIVFVLNTLGWLMLFFALFMGVLRITADDPELYYKLQMRENVPASAGISEDDLRLLDKNLAAYLFGNRDDPNAEIEVFGRMQPAFNEKELTHLADCRKLLMPAANILLNCFLAIAGVVLVLANKEGRSVAPAWTASAVILAPVVFLGMWAAMDFNSAFHFFHKILFTNDLWLLNPMTDLLIRICPASMFASMGLRIALMSVAAPVGLPLILTVIHHLSERKRKSDETQL